MKIENHTRMATKKLMEIIDFVMPSKHVKAEIDRDFTIRIEEHGGNNNQNVFSPRRKMIILQTSTSHKYPWKENKAELMFYNDMCKLVKKTTAPEDKEWVEKMVGPFEEVIEPNDECIDVEYLSRDDELVFAAAHELYHMKAYLYGKRLIEKSKEKAISEEKGNEIMSDRRADLYAIRKQKEWRKFHNQPIS